MDKKIENLKTAYANGDRIRIILAAQSLVEYSRKHPMAICLGTDRDAIVTLAKKIIYAAAYDEAIKSELDQD